MSEDLCHCGHLEEDHEEKGGCQIRECVCVGFHENPPDSPEFAGEIEDDEEEDDDPLC